MISEITQSVSDLYQRYPTTNLIFGSNYNLVMDEWLDRYPLKYQSHFYNPVLLDFCTWHFDNPDTQMYMWFTPNGSIKSRIDFCSDILILALGLNQPLQFQIN